MAQAVPRASIFRIKVFECAAKPYERELTGFLVSGYDGIITALHGVAGCRKRGAVGADKKHGFPDLQLTQVDIDRDLALLEATERPKKEEMSRLPKLKPSPPGDPDRLSELRVIGFPLTVNTVLTSRLQIRDDLYTSWHDTNSDAIGVLSDRGSPDLDVQMLNIEGHFLPGHSGAPVLNGKGQVVAVANGGLALGYAEISLAVPIVDFQPQPYAGVLQRKVDRLGSLSTENLFAIAHRDYTQKSKQYLEDKLGIPFDRESYLQAASVGDSVVVTLFLRIGIKVERGFEVSALHQAAVAGHDNIVRMLINAGADPNYRTEEATP
ncbi:MAG: trypsin-like peptidase domain-containing protein, partial [Bacteroidetes bacterium]|nr:trypsin-like peptidase domain-containing protein [Bacteroidota bacterium]